MSKPHVAIFVKVASSSTTRNPYHVGGLAANGLHSVAVLREMGVNADIHTIKNFVEMYEVLLKDRSITHAIAEAVWMSPEQAHRIGREFPHLTLVVRAHSKIGFLQVEPETIPVIRDIITYSPANVHFASNNEEFAKSLTEVYGKCLYLPNLYDLNDTKKHRLIPDNTIKIASFGATRLLKLHPTAALAALQIARELNMKLEFYVNSDSTPGGNSVRNTIRNMFAGLSWAKLIEVPWQDPTTFRHTIASMDLVLQLSATETFCLVAADAVSSGVPVVVSPAITWVDEAWQVTNVDDTSAVAKMGSRIFLIHKQAVSSQKKSLTKFVDDAKKTWAKFLNLPKKRYWL